MPEETDKYIRIPVNDAEDDDTIRTITISSSEGIKALYAVERKKILTVLFSKEKGWTMEKAREWIKEHKEDLKSFNFNNQNYMLQKLKGYLEKQEGEIVGIASTENVDRQGEVIRQEGWDLRNFKKNPILMLAHNYNELPIGKVTNVKVEENKLTFKAIFSEATQIAREAFQLVQEGILKAFSVGFIPREYDEKEPNVVTKAELLEISLVAIPANPQAMVVMKSMEKNELAKDILKRWLIDEKLKEKEKEENLDSAPEVGNDKENGEASAEVEAKELDIRLIQKTTGYLQQLCREIKQKGGKKNG